MGVQVRLRSRKGNTTRGPPCSPERPLNSGSSLLEITGNRQNQWVSVAATYLVIGIRSAPLGAPLPRTAVRPDGLIRHAYPVRSRGRVQSGYPGCPGAPHQPAQLAVRPAAKLRSAARLEPGPVAVALVAPGAGELGLGHQNAGNASGASSASRRRRPLPRNPSPSIPTISPVSGITRAASRAILRPR